MIKIGKTSTKDKLAIAITLFIAFVLLFVILTYGDNFTVLNPKGLIATKERGLIFLAGFLGLIVIIPVFTMTAFIAWKYRESNSKARYMPNWDHNIAIESTWWGIPSVIILVLSLVTWQSTHALNPFSPVKSTIQPLTVQVVALQWKWLFIYPKQNIASVNFVKFPVSTPINFQITSDAPMNSFWIPQLSGQMYAMSGMSTSLHIMATNQGTYRGDSANISGEGFASMNFIANVSNQSDFNSWVNSLRHSLDSLNLSSYNDLAQPSDDVKVNSYFLRDQNLYGQIIAKFLTPGNQAPPQSVHIHTD